VLKYVCVILIDFQAHRDAFIQNRSEVNGAVGNLNGVKPNERVVQWSEV